MFPGMLHDVGSECKRGLIESVNVLVVGGSGFIGSNLVKRLLIKKHLTSIIDIKEPCGILLSQGELEYHKLNAASKACSKVFETGYFNTVFYIAGGAFGEKDIDFGSEFNALINILDLCVEFHIEKFVYISSSYLNAYRPLSGDTDNKGHPWFDMYCTNKMTGERYCLVYKKLYGLKTFIIRLPQVYGPGQDMSGEGGVVLAILVGALRKKRTKTEVLANTFELSYISDVCDKLYGLMNNDVSGVYGYNGIRIGIDGLISAVRLLTASDALEVTCDDNIVIWPPEGIKPLNTPEENVPVEFGLKKTILWLSSLKYSELECEDPKLQVCTRDSKDEYDAVKLLLKNIRICFNNISEKFASSVSAYCNTVIKRFSGLYGLIFYFVRGAVKSFLNFIKRHVGTHFVKRHVSIPADKIKRMRKCIDKALPWAENTILCIFSVWIYCSLNLPFDARFICIMTIGLVNGVLHSIAAVMLCTVFSCFFPGNGIAEITGPDLLKTVIAYLFTAIVSGFAITRKRLELKELKESYGSLEKLYLQIRKDLSNKRKAASLMAEQIRTTEKCFGRMLGVIRKLNTFPAGGIILNMPDIISELTGFRDVELYLFLEEDDCFEFVCSTARDLDNAKTKKTFDLLNERVKSAVINNGNIYFSTFQDGIMPAVIMPLQHRGNGRTEVIIVIRNVPFRELNINTEYILNFVKELMSHELPDGGVAIRQCTI